MNKIPVICKKCGLIIQLFEDNTFTLEKNSVTILDTCKRCETTNTVDEFNITLDRDELSYLANRYDPTTGAIVKRVKGIKPDITIKIRPKE